MRVFHVDSVLVSKASYSKNALRYWEIRKYLFSFLLQQEQGYAALINPSMPQMLPVSSAVYF